MIWPFNRKSDRYYLSYKFGKLEIESRVTLEEFCKAERAAGFRPKLSSCDAAYMTTPATGGFDNGNIGGRIKYGKAA